MTDTTDFSIDITVGVIPVQIRVPDYVVKRAGLPEVKKFVEKSILKRLQNVMYLQEDVE